MDIDLVQGLERLAPVLMVQGSDRNHFVSKTADSDDASSPVYSIGAMEKAS
jgi:hypothetical protein